MEMSQFYKLRSEYEAKARARREERLNHGDDTPYHQTVLEEMVIDVLQQNADLRAEVDKVKSLVGLE
jgi:hypothetical protein